MTSLLLVGCGNMGSAMLSRWREKSPAGISNFFVVSPSVPSAFKSLAELPENISPDIIVFAVKPQMLAQVLPEYKNRFGVKPLYISIAAGKTLAFFAKHLGADARIIRTMPNTPALVGKAMTALCANANVLSNEKETATALMQAIGTSIWVAEKDMNAITAISGSGPAYLFLFLEALAEAGVKSGLDESTAKSLALATLHGSIHLAEKSGEAFAKLRENVTSKGGTTEAALAVLMSENGIKKILEVAVAEAIKKAEILAKQ